MTEEELQQTFREEWDAYRKERNDRLHRFFVKVVIIFACLGVTMSVTVWYVYHIAEQNRTGLCLIREEAEDRIAQTNEFLKEHPEGLDGISADQIRRGTRQAVQTQQALKDLDCEGSNAS